MLPFQKYLYTVQNNAINPRELARIFSQTSRINSLQIAHYWQKSSTLEALGINRFPEKEVKNLQVTGYIGNSEALLVQQEKHFPLRQAKRLPDSQGKSQGVWNIISSQNILVLTSSGLLIHPTQNCYIRIKNNIFLKAY